MCICVLVAPRNRVGGSTGVGRASASLTSRNYVAPAPEPLRTYVQAHTLTLEAEDQSAAAWVASMAQDARSRRRQVDMFAIWRRGEQCAVWIG